MEGLSSTLEKGAPKDSGPAKTWVDDVASKSDALSQWLENFRSSFAHAANTLPVLTVVNECEALMAKTRSVMDEIRLPLAVSLARDARSAQSLEYGLK